MTFVVRMALRELRASWRRLIFFFVCVALGVGAIVAIRSVVQTVRDAFTAEARTLTGADVIVQTNRPWTPDVTAAITRRFEAAGALQVTSAVETATMVRPAGGESGATRMVELMGVERAFPLYGTIELEDGRPYSHALLSGHGALVRPELLTQLGVRVGDRLAIGESVFTIRGVVTKEPGRRVGVFSFGGRVLVDLDDLPDTKLLQFGSRARYMRLARMPDERIDAFVREMRAAFGNQFVGVRSYRSTEDQVGEDLERAEGYLSLVGFVMVVLGGIGVWSVTRVFVRQKLKAIAVLKCVGASSRQVLAVYVAQVLALGLAGSLLGVGLAALALALLPASLAASLAGTVPTLTASAVGQGLGVGVLVSLLFALVPLLDIRHVKPLWLLRDQASFGQAAPGGPGGARVLRAWRRLDWVKMLAGTLVGALLVLVAAWQAGSWRAGLAVCGGFVVLAFVLHAAAGLLIRAIRPLAALRPFAVRHAIISMGRPGNQTRVILLAVGLGAFFILGVRSLETNLLREFSFDLRGGGADMFLIDIQPDQVDGLTRLLETSPGTSGLRVLPVLRARVTGVRGRTLNLDDYQDVRAQRLGREYVITYRSHLEANERIVDGAFWNGPGAEPEVSVEEGLRDRHGLSIGDIMRFDVLGRIIEARVTSVRHVEWTDARAGGFMFVFRPGPLDRAPQTAIAIMRGPESPEARGRLQREVVDRFANVSVVDVREIAAALESVLSNITLAISVVGAVALVSGLLILVGSVAMTKFQRLHESAVFKTLGASSRTIATMLALEYAVLGLLGGLIGALGSLVLSWAVTRHVLDIRWTATPWQAAAGLAATVLLVGIVGVVSSLDVLRRKPLSVLRAE